MKWLAAAALLAALALLAPACSPYAGYGAQADAQRNLHKWLRSLRTGDDERRARAAGMIRSLKAPNTRPAIRPLIAALRHDPHPPVRAGAAWSLGGIGGTRAFGPLIGALADRQPMVRAAAAKALRDVRDPRGRHCRDARVREPLIRLADDPDPTVRLAAVESLQANWGLVNTLYAEAVACARKRLTDADPGVRAAAATLLGRMRYAMDPAHHPLLAAIEDHEPTVRAAAAAALPWVVLAEPPHAPHYTPSLLAAVQDGDAAVRSAAARALGQIGRVGGREALRALARALASDPAPRVRAQAASALGELDDPATIDPLVDALTKDQDDTVCKAAAKAVARKGPAAVEALVAALRRTTPTHAAGVVKALAAVPGKSAVAPLTALLGDKEPAVRATAARALAYLRATSAAESLEPLLKDDSPEVRAAAAQALGNLGLTTSVPSLIEALRDEQTAVRAAAAQALGYIAPGRYGCTPMPPAGDPRAIEPLLAALKDDTADVRRAAADSLVLLSHHLGAAAKTLAALLEDPDWQVRAAAAHVLGHLYVYPFEAAIKAALADRDWRVRLALVRGESLRGYALLLSVVNDVAEHEAVRVAAIQSLVHVRRGGTTWLRPEHLLAVWNDAGNPQPVRAAAWRALLRLRALSPLRATAAK